PSYLGNALIVGGRAGEGQRVAPGAVRRGGDGRGDGHRRCSRIGRVRPCDGTCKIRAGTVIAACVESSHLNEIRRSDDEAGQGSPDDGAGRGRRVSRGYCKEGGCRAGRIGSPIIDSVGRDAPDGASVSVDYRSVPGGVKNPPRTRYRRSPSCSRRTP